MGVSAKLHAIALTDHDSIAGVPEFLAAAHACGIPALPGVELNTCFCTADLHLLGYGFDLHNEALLQKLAQNRRNRATRNARMLEVLASLGYPLDKTEVEAVAGDPETIGRPHVAQAMVNRGYVHDVREAFDRFLGDGKPADVPREQLTTVEGIHLLRAAGGIPVWAHPRGGFSSSSFRKILPILVAEGLGGVEAYHPNHSNTKTRDVLAAAKEFRLIATGGSDFHGTCKPDISIGRGNGKLRVPDDCWDALQALLSSAQTR